MYEISSGRDYSLKRVKADSTRTHLLPRSSSCVHVCARLHVPIYTHKRRIVEPVVVNGSACRGLGQLGLPSIAGQLFLVSSYRCIPDMHPRLHCADTWSGIHRKLHVHSHVYGVFACRVIAAITANRQMQKNARHGKWYPPREGSSFEYDKNGIKIRNQENIVPTFLPVTCAFNASTFYVLRAQ